MELRLSSRWTPSPEVALAWGSQSTRRIFKPSKAKQAARLMAVVVLPTPPFLFTITRILPMVFQTIWKRSGVKVLDTVQNSAICGELLRSRTATGCKRVQRQELRTSKNEISGAGETVDGSANPGAKFNRIRPLRRIVPRGTILVPSLMEEDYRALNPHC